MSLVDSNLPNNDPDRIKVYPNEYITNSTINRPNLRLLDNDYYLENLFRDAISGQLHISGLLNHGDLSNVTPNQHHPQLHSILSHNDVFVATGPDLDQLTDGSDAGLLHYHTTTTAHGPTHTNGVDDVQDASDIQKGLMNTNDQSFAGNKTFTEDIRVNGTFTATSAVFIETEILGLSANFLELNSNYSGSSPSEDAGINVNRGTLDDSVIRWNETSDQWEGGLTGATEKIILLSDMTTYGAGNFVPLSGTSSLAGSIIPNNGSVDLGSAANPFNALYVAGSTVHVGDENISESDIIAWNTATSGGVPPSVHGLGSSSHSTATLAQLNAKVSGATLIDTADSRLSDARTPVSHNNTYHSTNYEAEFSKNTAFNKNFGTASSTVCQGNDSRLSDARTPTTHGLGSSSHSTATLAQLNAKVSDANLKDQIQIDFFIAGNYNDAINLLLLATDMNTYFRWGLPNAKLVAVYATHKVPDGTSQPTVNIRRNGSAYGSLSNITLAGAGSWQGGGPVSTTTITAGDLIEVSCNSLAGGAGDASDLTISVVFEWA